VLFFCYFYGLGDTYSFTSFSLESLVLFAVTGAEVGACGESAVTEVMLFFLPAGHFVVVL